MLIFPTRLFKCGDYRLRKYAQKQISLPAAESDFNKRRLPCAMSLTQAHVLHRPVIFGSPVVVVVENHVIPGNPKRETQLLLQMTIEVPQKIVADPLLTV